MQKLRTALGRKGVLATFVLLGALAHGGCSTSKDASLIGTFRMGEKVQAGPLVYTVLESEWKTSLTDGGRAPANRFLFLRVSIENLSQQPIAVPGLRLQGTGDREFNEMTEDMQDVKDWLGMLRNLQPSQTERGWIVFDAPVAAYKLVVSDGGDIGVERHALIDIPVDLQ